MTEQKHSPLPWKINVVDERQIDASNDKPVGHCYIWGPHEFDVAKANAALIVRAVNMHPLLLEVYNAYVEATPEDLSFDWIDWANRVGQALTGEEAK